MDATIRYAHAVLGTDSAIMGSLFSVSPLGRSIDMNVAIGFGSRCAERAAVGFFEYKSRIVRQQFKRHQVQLVRPFQSDSCFSLRVTNRAN